MLDALKTVAANRKKRELWPIWMQIAFYLVFYAISVAWVLLGSGIAHGVGAIGLFGGYEAVR